jgi:FeS assembly SUF system protein
MFGRSRRQEPAAAAVTAEPDVVADGKASEEAAETVESAEVATADQLPLEVSSLEVRIVDALKSIFDPEIPVNIYELGLIYDVALPEGDAGPVSIKMTLTSPHCPVAESLPGDVKRRVEAVAGVSQADVEIVWDPAWNPDMMSEAAKLELGFF